MLGFVFEVGLELFVLILFLGEVLLELLRDLLHLINEVFLLLEGALEVLLFLLSDLYLTDLSLIVILELLIVILYSIDLLLFFQKISIQPVYLLLKVVHLLLVVLNELILLIDLAHQQLFLVHHLSDTVVLADIQPGALVNDLTQVRDLVLQVSDYLSRFLLVVLCLVNQFPGFFHLFLKDANVLGVLSGQFDRGLYSRGVLEDGFVELLASIKREKGGYALKSDDEGSLVNEIFFLTF